MRSVPPSSFSRRWQRPTGTSRRTRRIVFRIGLHLGDLIVDGDDLYGDGVNVAARLEAEAPSVASSCRVPSRRRLRSLKATFADLGSLALKNIEATRPGVPSGVAGVGLAGRSVDNTILRPSHRVRPSLALPDKPSIAVLPFPNMSGDPEQEYFVDGMVEDMTTALSKIEHLMRDCAQFQLCFQGPVQRHPRVRPHPGRPRRCWRAASERAATASG